MKKINISEKFRQFDDLWSPKVIGELNGQQVKLAKVQGVFVWHAHEYEDELFMVQKGTLIMEFRDRTVEVGPGECIIVPRGIEHNPRTKHGEIVHLLLFEPIDIKHTGEVEDAKTVKTYEWLDD